MWNNWELQENKNKEMDAETGESEWKKGEMETRAVKFRRDTESSIGLEMLVHADMINGQQEKAVWRVTVCWKTFNNST